jgi:16S rRNA (guanine527-N7)-methyltransferase
MVEYIFRNFPSLDTEQKKQISLLKGIYEEWNSKINVISRKDMDNFFIRHVLHSMAIAKVVNFLPDTHILDIGTGGGFPGIPLAILFPEARFTLLDSIEKKIKVVSSVAEQVNLKNVETIRKRVEDFNEKFDFVVSRAVTEFTNFVKLSSKNISPGGKNTLQNGIIYLKGGDLSEETAPFRNRVVIWNIKDFFDDLFFETKHIIFLPV